jgi:hypothetical protein
MAKEVAKPRTTTEDPLLLNKVSRNCVSQARRREIKSRASWGISGSTSIINECHGLKLSGAATLEKLRTTTARTVFWWRESDKINGARSSSPSKDRLGSSNAIPSLWKALELHHSGISMDVNPMGKKWSKLAFFSIFSTIQRSSFIISPQYESQKLDAGWLLCFARSCLVKKKRQLLSISPPATLPPPPTRQVAGLLLPGSSGFRLNFLQPRRHFLFANQMLALFRGKVF